MTIPDVNILVYAYNKDAKQHKVAREWWERTLTQPQSVGLPWITILGFIRISTQRRIIERPMFPHQAIERVRSWLDLPNVQIISPGEAHGQILFRLIEDVGTAGDLTTDAHLAALAIEHRAQLVSTDADFARFRRLQLAGPDMLIDGYDQYNQQENEIVNISPEDGSEEPAEALPRADDCMSSHLLVHFLSSLG